MKTLERQAAKLLALCKKRGLKIVTAESCTGGLIAAVLTEIPGASDVFERGYVTYSNKSKRQLLGVPKKLLHAHGAVSEQVAKAMAKGARKNAKTDLSIAVTGIAGPTDGTKQKPVGTVFIAVVSNKKIVVKKFRFKGNRSEIRMQSVAEALKMAKTACETR